MNIIDEKLIYRGKNGKRYVDMVSPVNAPVSVRIQLLDEGTNKERMDTAFVERLLKKGFKFGKPKEKPGPKVESESKASK